ncbi:MAG: hypothetical protein HC786_14005 [Richelia sp. CSU_2_1]|nr:hypothetical protein [Microcoleus sp. SU_5_6]NJL68007.1 hypothetical protein [Microcoleus sp. SM1_3_4]NJR23186.1 hypothetical protein [Richelia sp. CSU_2_1]
MVQHLLHCQLSTLNSQLSKVNSKLKTSGSGIVAIARARGEAFGYNP